MKLRKSTVAVCATAALVTGGIFAAGVIGEGGNGGHGMEIGRETAPVLPTHQLTPFASGAKASALGESAATGRRRKPRIRYFETDPFQVGSDEAATLECPPRSKAISGYLVTDHAGIVLDYSAISGFTGPFRPRRWSFGLLYAQLNQTAHDAQLGIVCANGVR